MCVLRGLVSKSCPFLTKNLLARVRMCTQGLENLLQSMSALKGPLNSCGGSGQQASVGLGLVNTTSVQLARYPGDGRGYVRHRDTPESAQDSEEAERKVRTYPAAISQT